MVEGHKKKDGTLGGGHQDFQEPQILVIGSQSEGVTLHTKFLERGSL